MVENVENVENVGRKKINDYLDQIENQLKIFGDCRINPGKRGAAAWKIAYLTRMFLDDLKQSDLFYRVQEQEEEIERLKQRLSELETKFFISNDSCLVESNNFLTVASPSKDELDTEIF